MHSQFVFRKRQNHRSLFVLPNLVYLAQSKRSNQVVFGSLATGGARHNVRRRNDCCLLWAVLVVRNLENISSSKDTGKNDLIGILGWNDHFSSMKTRFGPNRPAAGHLEGERHSYFCERILRLARHALILSHKLSDKNHSKFIRAYIPSQKKFQKIKKNHQSMSSESSPKNHVKNQKCLYGQSDNFWTIFVK